MLEILKFDWFFAGISKKSEIWPILAEIFEKFDNRPICAEFFENLEIWPVLAEISEKFEMWPICAKIQKKSQDKDYQFCSILEKTIVNNSKNGGAICLSRIFYIKNISSLFNKKKLKKNLQILISSGSSNMLQYFFEDDHLPVKSSKKLEKN